MVQRLETVESALVGEIARVSAARERLLVRASSDIRFGIEINSRIALMGLELEEAREAIEADDAPRAARAWHALRSYDAYE